MAKINSNINLSEIELKHILVEVKCLTGFNFSQYAYNFIKSRTEKFMHKNNIVSEADLIYRINKSSNMAGMFLDNVFFPQYELFRDAEMWNFLEKNILTKFAKKAEVNIHFPFSSGGESLFSLLYLLKSFNTQNYQIHITGVSDKHISEIKKEQFTATHIKESEKNIALLNSAIDKDDVFISKNNYSFKINYNYKGKLIYKTCDFFKGKQLSEFDLVFFQNKMIFFNSELKEKALFTIIKSLKKGGYVIIGEKEKIGKSAERKIKQVDKKISLYKRKIFS